MNVESMSTWLEVWVVYIMWGWAVEWGNIQYFLTYNSWGKKHLEDDGKVVEWEHDIIRNKPEFYERIVIPTMVYGSLTWSLSAQERRKVEVFEMMCLKNICGIRRVRNAIIREVRVWFECTERIERNVLKWFGHVERMGEERLVKRVYQANVEGNRGRGGPQRR